MKNYQRSDETEAKECLRAVYNYAHAPALFFATTSGGFVRVVDTRESLRWHDREAQIFANPPRAEDGQYSAITSALSGCDLSPCGRYIAARDFFGVTVWDVRLCAPSSSSTLLGSKSSGGPLCRVEIQADLRGHLDSLYNADLLADKFDIRFVDASTVFTGGYHSQCSMFDACKASVGPSHLLKFTIPTADEMSSRGNPYIERQRLDVLQQGTQRSQEISGGDFGLRVKFVSGVRRTAEDECETIVAVGDTLTSLRICR